MNNQFTTILGGIKQVTEQDLVDIYLPTHDKSVKFKKITVRQQKDIVKTAMDKVSPGLLLHQALNEILATNLVDATVQLSTADRFYTLVALRAASIGDTYQEKVSLTEMLKKKIHIPATELQHTVKEGVVTVECKVPSLSYDSQITADCIEKIQDANLVGAFGDVFIGEVIKYVDSLTVNSATIKLAECTFTQKYQLIESLPASINNQVLVFANKVKAAETKFCTVNDVAVNVNIDQAFFTT